MNILSYRGAELCITGSFYLSFFLFVPNFIAYFNGKLKYLLLCASARTAIIVKAGPSKQHIEVLKMYHVSTLKFLKTIHREKIEDTRKLTGWKQVYKNPRFQINHTYNIEIWIKKKLTLIQIIQLVEKRGTAIFAETRLIRTGVRARLAVWESLPSLRSDNWVSLA